MVKIPCTMVKNGWNIVIIVLKLMQDGKNGQNTVEDGLNIVQDGHNAVQDGLNTLEDVKLVKILFKMVKMMHKMVEILISSSCLHKNWVLNLNPLPPPLYTPLLSRTTRTPRDSSTTSRTSSTVSGTCCRQHSVP